MNSGTLFILTVMGLIVALTIIGFGIYALIFHVIGMIGLIGEERELASVGLTFLSMLCIISAFNIRVNIEY